MLVVLFCLFLLVAPALVVGAVRSIIEVACQPSRKGYRS